MYVYVETFLIFLFNNPFVSHRPGKFYLCNDFCDDLFSDSDFMFKNKLFVLFFVPCM